MEEEICDVAHQGIVASMAEVRLGYSRNRGFVGGMTNKKYAHLNRVSPATAQRDLAELAARGVLRLQGGGRSVRYELAD